MSIGIRKIGLVIAALLFFGCEGKEGPAGPTGNANVQSLHFTIASNDWLAGGTNSVYFTKTTSMITGSVVGGGSVLMYFQLGPTTWAPLPNSFVNSSNQLVSIQFSYGLENGVGGVTIVMASNTLTANELKLNMPFKAVIIDGKINLGKVDINDYNAVMKYLNVQE